MTFTTNRTTRRGLLAGILAAVVLPVGLVTAPPAEAQSRGWVRLGSKEVDGRRDSDSIHVDRPGRFRALMFRVTDSAARINNVTVHFENGTRYRPAVRRTFSRGTRSHVIDLPGGRRDIDRVTFRYSDLRGRRDADVTLFGLR